MSRRTTTVAAPLAVLAVLAVLAALGLAGCSGGDDGAGGSSSSKPRESDPPVESAVPGGTATPTGAAPRVVSTVATGLAVPWGLAFLPDGTAVVTERDSGRVLTIGGADHTVTEVGQVAESQPTGEGGLLGVAVSPSYATDHALFFYTSTADDNRIVTARLDGTGADARLGATTPVLTGIPVGSIHDGGRLAFGPDGMLYASTGETGDNRLAQDKTSLAGKILRMTPRGDPAPGNPFGSLIWSYGHRNVQGLAFVGDQLWASEFGQNDYDELNRIEAGDDYGWPLVEGGGGTSRGFVDPQVTWDTDDASPSGLAYADGSLWLGALQGERLWEIPVTGDGADEQAGKPTASFVGDYGRLRTVVTAPDGTLWVTTSNRDGRGDPQQGDDRILQVTP